MKYAHTNIVSSNWKALSQFYIRVFECVPVPPARDQSGEWLERGTNVKNAHLQGIHLMLPGHGSTGPTLEIYQYDHIISGSPASANRQGFGHIAFEVESVQETLDLVIEHGGSKHGEIVSKEIPGVGHLTFTYLKDPDGNLIEVQHWERNQ